MDFQQSAEELLTKLDTYREQLAQVEEAAAAFWGFQGFCRVAVHGVLGLHFWDA